MADIVDVESALAVIVAGIVYPNGTGQPSIIGADVKIYRGWPVASQLDLDMQGLQLAGNPPVQQARPGGALTNISIFSPPGAERNTTRYPQEQQTSSTPTHTVTATVSGNQITIGGAISTPQNVVILCGVNLAFPYQVQPADTVNTIAANLAALIAASFHGTSATGPVISIAGEPGIVVARVGGQFQIWTEIKRQERSIQITLWCPTPAARDTLGAPLDVALAALDFFVTSDNSAVRLRYARTLISDEAQKVQIYRRDIFYTIEYPTASVTTAPETVTIGASTQINGGTSSPNQFA